MHRTFIPVPDWLEPSKKTIQNCLPSFSSLEFQLRSFEILYRLGMTDRQVAELTSLFILLSEKDKFHIVLSEAKVALEQKPVCWYWNQLGFCKGNLTLEELIRCWIAESLPKTDTRNNVASKFWSGDLGWESHFISAFEYEHYVQLVERTRVKFAQYCFKIPATGTWSEYARVVCKNFQKELPSSVAPWKNGNLDGFTYKLLVKNWKRSKDILV